MKCWKMVQDIVIDKVMEKDEEGNYKWTRIVVVGYSHGGALAALCHECVWYNREDLREGDALMGYGFEAPRVYAGWRMPKALKERWKNFTVYRNKNDIVTHLPPVLFGFRHVGKMKVIGADSACGPILAHTRTWVRVGLGAQIDDIEAALKEELKKEPKNEG